MTVMLAAISLFPVAAQPVIPDLPERSIVFVAHRGGIVPGYPENTLVAFHKAIEHGAQAIEIDLRGTKDGAIVIMHDETVDRTTNGHGKVTDLTLAELKALDTGDGERIPTYEEVLQLVEGTGVTLLLDIKESELLDKRLVVRLTEKHNAILNVIVGARNLEDLSTFKALNMNLRTLGFIPSAEDAEPFVKAGVDIIRLWPKWIYSDHDLIKKVKSFNKPIWTTAADAKPDELKRLIKLGVNGILSDFPEVMSSLRDDMKTLTN